MTGVLRALGLAANFGGWLLVGLAITCLVIWQLLAVGIFQSIEEAVLVGVVGVVAGLAWMVAHELGHAAVGRALGIPLREVSLVLARITWEGGRRVVRFNSKLYAPCAIVYFEFTGVERWRLAAAIAAGPMTNLILAGMCFVAADVVNPQPPPSKRSPAKLAGWEVALVQPRSTMAATFNVAGLASLFLGLICLVPSQSRGQSSDGQLLLDLALGHLRAGIVNHQDFGKADWPQRTGYHQAEEYREEVS
ncbi:MAG TPA: site-2 protease family protein [Gemmatales bacterium]|nr:site-2 protease family protein [Gemmatales bacterium]HMP59481.1 site-2 protease family protein [Gemmatales bacterium]